MPAAAEHRNRIEHNRSFASLIKSSHPSYLDWALTTVFHIAVHQIERFACVKANAHFRTHVRRMKFLSITPQVSSLYGHYEYLKTKSEQARYGSLYPTPDDVADAEAVLAKIEAHIDQLLT